MIPRARVAYWKFTLTGKPRTWSRMVDGLCPPLIFLPYRKETVFTSDLPVSTPDGVLVSCLSFQVYLSLADAVVREVYRAGETTADIPEVMALCVQAASMLSRFWRRVTHGLWI